MNERSGQPEDGTQGLPQSGLKDEVLDRNEDDHPGLLYRFADSLRSGEEEQEKPEEPEVWLVFRLGESSFGLPVADIREVMRVGAITRVPQAPFAVAGVTDLRGRVIPIVDLGARFRTRSRRGRRTESNSRSRCRGPTDRSPRGRCRSGDPHPARVKRKMRTQTPTTSPPL